jgi:HK97 family phage major capsid protein/HK97 family phage prohead protease
MSEHATRMVPFEVTRASDDGLTFEGYAAVWDSPTLIDSWEGRFAERIARGAFKKTITERTPVLQFDHGTHPLIGSIPLGSITTLREDDKGLFVRARLSDNWLIQPVRDAIRDGAVNGMSFRFRAIRDEHDDDAEWARTFGDDVPGRTLLEVAMPELGPVVFPAYEATEAGVRNELAMRMEEQLKASQTSDEPDEVRDTDVSTDDGAAPEGTPEPAAVAAPDEPASRHSTAPDTQTTKEHVVMEMTLSVEERAARQDEIKARLAQIDADHTGAALPTEIREEWDTLNSEYDEHQRAIDDDRARKARLENMARTRPQTTSPGVPTIVPDGARTRNIWDLAEARNEARSAEDLPTVYRDRAKRAIELARFGGVNREDAQTQAERLLDTIDDKDATLAKRMLITGSPLYERAFGKAVESLSTGGLNPEEQRALAVGTDNKGGYAVPFALDPTIILTNDGTINPLRQIARVEQITTKTWQGVTSAGVTVARAAEAAQVAANDPTLAQPEVTPQRVHGFIPFSIEVDQDWTQMRSEMSRLLADAKDIEEAASFITGDGTTAQQPGGIPGSLTAAGSLEYVGASWDDEDVYDLESNLAPRFRARASFLANKAVFNTIRQFADADGHDLWERIGAGMPAQLLGYNAYEASDMDDDSEDGNKFLLFGDFGQFLIVDRVGMSVELVPHLFGANQRPTGQRGLYAIWRNDSKILVPNAFRVLVKGTS